MARDKILIKLEQALALLEKEGLTAARDATTVDRVRTALVWRKIYIREVAARTRHSCSVCGLPQHKTPSGLCCYNGHGGAASVVS